MLEVLIPGDTRLTTLAAVKAELGITDTADDALLQTYIDQASAMIERFCGRWFGKATYRETLAGYGTSRLLLSCTPIVQVIMIECDGALVTDYLVEDADAGILYRDGGWAWSPKTGGYIERHPVAGAERLNYVITYEAGYILPENAGSNLPADIQRACIDLVKVRYAERSRDPSITSERLGDWQASYSTDSITPQVVQILAPWRRAI